MRPPCKTLSHALTHKYIELSPNPRGEENTTAVQKTPTHTKTQMWKLTTSVAMKKPTTVEEEAIIVPSISLHKHPSHHCKSQYFFHYFLVISMCNNLCMRNRSVVARTSVCELCVYTSWSSWFWYVCNNVKVYIYSVCAYFQCVCEYVCIYA